LEPYSSSKRIRPRQHHLSSPRYSNNSVPAVGTCKRRRYAAQRDSNMGRCRGLYRVANLLSRVSESSVVQRASVSDATLARRGLSSSATSSLHACQAPIAAGRLRKVACEAVQQISSAATAITCLQARPLESSSKTSQPAMLSGVTTLQLRPFSPVTRRFAVWWPHVYQKLNAATAATVLLVLRLS